MNKIFQMSGVDENGLHLPVKRVGKMVQSQELEDLKVLRRSPDLLNNVKIGQGFTIYGVCRHFGQVT